MNKPTDAEIIALADETRTGEPGREGYILPISFARAVLAKWGTQQPATQPAQAAEPVSHQYQSKDGTWHEFIDQRHYNQTVASGGWPIRALYTAPQPVGREPLSDDEVDSLCKVGPVYAPDGKVMRTPPQYRDELEAAQRYGLRKGERAHGIKKGGQHGTE